MLVLLLMIKWYGDYEKQIVLILVDVLVLKIRLQDRVNVSHECSGQQISSPIFWSKSFYQDHLYKQVRLQSIQFFYN